MDSSSGNSMGDMDMGNMDMTMGTFHWSSTGDALWFDSWMPKSEPAYIGACIGLFVFAVVSRGLLACEIYFVAWRARRFESLHQEGGGAISISQVKQKKEGIGTVLQYTKLILSSFFLCIDSVKGSFLIVIVSIICSGLSGRNGLTASTAILLDHGPCAELFDYIIVVY